MKTVALYGHKFIDNFMVFDEFKVGCNNVPKKSLVREGGISNVKRVLDESKNIHSFRLPNPEDGHSSIIIDKNNTTIISDFRGYGSFLEPVEADWHHIAYVDRLPGLNEDFFKSLKGVVSVDTAGLFKDIDRLKMILSYTDFWFQSCEHNILRRLGYIPNKKTTLLTHSPFDCRISSYLEREQGIDTIHDHNIINSVGAGDYFAGGFIATTLLAPATSIKHRVIVAHTLARQALRDYDV